MALYKKEAWFCNDCQHVGVFLADEDIKMSDMATFLKIIKHLCFNFHKQVSPTCTGGYSWVNSYIMSDPSSIAESNDIPEWAKERVIHLLFGE